MCSDNAQNLDELTKTLLKKCEVSNLNQLYAKWVLENDHSLSIKTLCVVHKNFTESKVYDDVLDIPELICISVFDFSRSAKPPQDLTREKFVVDYIGLGKLIKSLRRKRILSKSSNLTVAFKLLGLDESQTNKAVRLLQRAIEEFILYAQLFPVESTRDGVTPASTQPTLVLTFHSKFKDPSAKSTLIKLIATIVVAIISIAILIPIIIIINS